jgi:hypothetical protein
MKRLLMALGVAGLVAVSAAGGASAAGAGQPSENASCMGIERATRNSNGGDREHGGFGPLQSDYVKSVQPYGQWLQDEWKPANCK